ncbi:MAG TPA: type II secretion system protein GspM [Anaeromyxobacteraceae bacterium]|jgi:general secretion pathway protein M|nr:type II secretion system protein GspM [Anaeromyxobacteraceae bacterium]
MDFLRRLRAELENALTRLSPRERVMVAAAAGAVALFVILMVTTSVSRGIRAREARIDDKTRVLSQIGRLAQGYRAAQAERQAMEARLKGPPLQLMSYVSQAGQRLGIEVNDLRPGQGTSGAGSDQVLEDSVEVNLARIDPPRLVQLLRGLESGPGVVKVRRLRISTRGDDPNLVDVTLLVATYQLKG